MTRNNAMLWAAAGVSSVLLLGIVIAQVDWAAAREIGRTVDLRWVMAGIGVLLLEGVITALRFRLLAHDGTPVRGCFLATAWYVLMLIGLPARLGEFAGIGLIVRYMHQRPGVATASLLFQRVFDMLLLVAMLALVAVLAFAQEQLGLVLIASAAVFALLAATVVFLEPLLALAARRLIPCRRNKVPAFVLRAVLQARMYSRHQITRSRLVRLAVLTTLKWGANLAGIALVVVAVVPALTVPAALGVGIVYNLSAVVPVQTIGGFGISELVLLGSFQLLGYGLGVGAPIAIAIRLALISAPVVFWFLVLTLTAGFSPARAQP